MSLVVRTGRGEFPANANGFVGRGRELAMISAALSHMGRLITLIGPAGIGKTRLAAEATSRFRKSRPVPVHWVRLARLPRGADFAALEAEVAYSVLERDITDRPAHEAVVDALSRTDAVGQDLQAVLVLDNCEHVLEPVGELIAGLLDAIPGLSVVATSREAIGWSAERLIAVPPLTTDEALSLFRSRAELTGHPIVGSESVELVGQICRHMHNSPLHIQLAAARLPRQPLPLILQDLDGGPADRRLQWTHGPRFGTDERHRGVRDVIQWSYDLCDDKESLLFRRMSVFAVGYDAHPDDRSYRSLGDAGADLAAIVAVCADEPDAYRADQQLTLAADEIQDLLERLVDRSLVAVHISSDMARYSLLESFRLFAEQRLRVETDGEEFARLAARHRRYYRDKIASAQADPVGAQDQSLVDWACAAWGNIREAVESSVGVVGEAEIGLQIAVGLVALRIPLRAGSLRELRRWAESALAAACADGRQLTGPELAAAASIASLAVYQGKRLDAKRMLDECVAAYFGDTEIAATWRQHPEVDLGFPAEVEFAWGTELMVVYRDPAAIEVLERAQRKFEETGDQRGAIMSAQYAAMTAGLLTTAEQAMTLASRHRQRTVDTGARWALSWAELAWAIALTKNGDSTAALAASRAALADQVRRKDRWGSLWSVHIRVWSLAPVAAGMADREEADPLRRHEAAVEIARLTGGLIGLRRKLGVDLAEMGLFADHTAAAIEAARKVLGPDAFAAAEQEGRQLRVDNGDVEQVALGVLSVGTAVTRESEGTASNSGWSELSGAEQDVAILAAAGWTNASIAARRGSSFRTVDAQMSTVFLKLMISSRAEIIEYVPGDLRGRVREESRKRPPRRGGRTSVPDRADRELWHRGPVD